MIAAVVLTFDAPDGMLEACLASVTADPTLLVVLVDNGHRAAQLPADVLGRVTLVEAPYNLGYAGGMNLGIRVALEQGADAVAVLNDDLTVEPGWLAPLVSELAAPTVGAAQPVLLAADATPARINSMGVRLGNDGAGIDIGQGELVATYLDQPPHDLELFTGGAVLMSASFLRSTGGFDERYFLYYEDVDLALRGAELGWRYRLAPASHVVHRGSVSASAPSLTDRTTYLRERNRLWVLFRHRPLRHVATGVWLSVRRLRWAPRLVHARALVAGVAGVPRLLVARHRRS